MWGGSLWGIFPTTPPRGRAESWCHGPLTQGCRLGYADSNDGDWASVVVVEDEGVFVNSPKCCVDGMGSLRGMLVRYER